MIQLTESLWIGDSSDEEYGDLATPEIKGVLNVAQDLQGTRGGWKYGLEYMQVGLIDGPGNPIAAYHAAVLALYTMQKRRNTLVYCHSGGRALAVALMYINLTNGSNAWPGEWRSGWDGWLGWLANKIRPDVDGNLPVPHEAHKAAFAKINWRLLMAVTKD